MSMEKRPPKFFRRLLEWFCHPDMYEELEGDLEESYLENLQRRGPAFASARYRVEVLRLFRPSVVRPIRFSLLPNIIPDMLYNYFRVAWRNLFNQKVYGIINIAGLAIGLACVILIALYVRKELSYDTFHEKAERIARLTHSYSFVQAPWGPTLKAEMPEVEDATRVYQRHYQQLVTDDGKAFFETVYAAEQNFFDLFTFPFIEGDSATALANPNSLVLTESAAVRYFGTTEVMGRSLRTGGMMGHDSIIVQVTGVIEDVPDNAHFSFDQLFSFKLMESGATSDLLHDWEHDWACTYLLLRDPADIATINAGMERFLARHREDPCHHCRAQPLLKARLYSGHLQEDIAEQGNIHQVRIFSAIAILILLIACINFMNLATARASRRAKEVGVRKAIGALRQQIIGQFLVESFLLTLISILVSLAGVWLALPHFETLVGITVLPEGSERLRLLWALLGLTVLVSLLSGAYPALSLSRFHPAANLKNRNSGGRNGAWLRKGLVSIQFAVSIVLIIGTMVVYNQIRYMKNRPLGFNMEQVLFINFGRGLEDKLPVIKQELLQNPNIREVASTSQIMGNNAFSWRFKFEGAPQNSEGEDFPQFAVGQDFFETLDIEILDGRAFSKNYAADTAAFLLNEKMVEELAGKYGEKWRNPVGRTLEYIHMDHGEWEVFKEGPVIGVVKDFHNRSLQNDIQPLIIHYEPDWVRRLVIRVNHQNIPATLAFLEQQWAKWGRDRPFNYHFLEEHFNASYQSESYFSRVLFIFCFLAIFIACLGLFGLASYSAEQRTKEIGVRKVMGASVANVAALFLKSFLQPIALAIVIGGPLAWWLMNRWLQGFAFRTDIGVLEFVLAGLLIFLVAVITIGHRTLRAARSNPVGALRCE